MTDANDPKNAPLGFRPSREPTGQMSPSELEQVRASLEPKSGGSDAYSRVEGEDDLHEVQADLPDLAKEMSAMDGAEGRYADGPMLGAGGMGEVRLRKDRRIGRSIAAKIMHAHVETAETRQRFLREARVQGQLEHPAIVPVYDLGVEDGRLFFTMKRVRGQTLARILFGIVSGEAEYVKRFPRRRLLSAYLQVCRAVHYAHVHGVLHRDLKPSNVMIGDFGEVYVLDWGLARALEARPSLVGPIGDRVRHSIVQADPSRVKHFKPNITKPGNLIGTLSYMSPEQARSEPLDARADVYSLGVILFEILALRRFRDDSNYLRVIAQIVDGVIARPSEFVDIDPMLDAICVKATAIEQHDRYDTALEVAEAVERWLDGARDAESQKRNAAAAIAGAKERIAAPDAETRASAMHDLLRAHTLDPDNVEAPQLLLAALEGPDAALPKEVESEIAARRAARPSVLPLLSVAAVLALAVPPTVYAIGERSLVVLGVTSAASLALLVLLWLARGRYDEQLAKLDDGDRRLSVQAYHLRRLFPADAPEQTKNRLSGG
jgi:serine/threonine-protein kinase